MLVFVVLLVFVGCGAWELAQEEGRLTHRGADSTGQTPPSQVTTAHLQLVQVKKMRNHMKMYHKNWKYHSLSSVDQANRESSIPVTVSSLRNHMKWQRVLELHFTRFVCSEWNVTKLQKFQPGQKNQGLTHKRTQGWNQADKKSFSHELLRR